MNYTKSLKTRQSNHLTDIRLQVDLILQKRYLAGAAADNLLDMLPRQLLENAIEETVDQLVYLLTLREKL